ncbi:MAG TPA: sugar isomerase [Sediminispirochaeta sp.]|nr:sugar isomerase [Sediminispirochaeta sp.]
MKRENKKYAPYALVKEMYETVDVVANFDPQAGQEAAGKIREAGKLLLTGEGSSRIFPAKNAIRSARRAGLDIRIETEGSRQAAEYDLHDHAVFCASNSGKTKEVVLLARKLKEAGHNRLFALTAAHGSLLEEICDHSYVLGCGPEEAVAATKSVVEQGLFYQAILRHLDPALEAIDSRSLAHKIEAALNTPIEPSIVEAAAAAPTIYFAGYNDGVAEELTLKTNEITRKKSDFLEGTYAVHGIEEVMNPADILFLIDPIDDEIEKFQEVLVQGVGLKVVAIADRQTPFPTIIVPPAGLLTPFVYLSAGWNLLVEIGLSLGIDLDKPERARKVGNEFLGT